MKLLTLNVNSYLSENSTRDMANLCAAIADTDFDVIAFQEVNQENTAEEVPISQLDEYIPCQDRVPIKKDNYVYQIVKALGMSGQLWYWTWLPTHLGWDHFDEGLAILTRHPIIKTHAFYLSESTDYLNPKTRMALGIQSDFDGEKEWFYNVHTNKWSDVSEPFDNQWDRFVDKALDTKSTVYVMGDFNIDSSVKGEGYDYILATSELYDSLEKAEYKDDGITVDDFISGWENHDHPKEFRCDYIFTNTDKPILASEVIFNGKNYPKVSDHMGLAITIGEKLKIYRNDKSNLPEFSSQALHTELPALIIKSGTPVLLRSSLKNFITDQEADFNHLFKLIQDTLDLLSPKDKED